VLFIAGRQDDLVGYKDMEKILNNYSRASICIVDEAGHNLQIEKMKIVEALTLDWIERIQRNENKV
jgi:pimeloyl-ACP methyl ester carboxylesterase